MECSPPRFGVLLSDYLFFKKKKSKKNPETYRSSSIKYNGQEDPYFPEEFTIPFVEVFCGVLLCVIPSGVTQAVGVALILDAGSRTIEVLKEMEKENNQNNTPSSTYKKFKY